MSMRASNVIIGMRTEGATPHGGESHLSALNNQRSQKLVPLTRRETDKGKKKERKRKTQRKAGDRHEYGR